MKKATLRSLIVLIFLSTLFLIFGAVSPVRAPLSSTNVVFVPSASNPHGGTLSTVSPDFDAFSFSTMAWASVSAANLAPYDTVVLMISTQTVPLNPSQQADLIAWLSAGGKLIIYDSETTPYAEYSWFPYPFRTLNPGAMGYVGGNITFMENNTLGCSDPLNTPYYISPAQYDGTGSGSPTYWSDALGDCNTFVTYDGHWCGDIKATNAYSFAGTPSVPAHSKYNGSAPGWVHAYARYGDGLVIYNGLDIDPSGSNTVPSSTGVGRIAKIWLLELKQPWNPDGLPCEAPATGIKLEPLSDTNPVGTSHTVTATVVDDWDNPVQGVVVTFEVKSGPNTGKTDTDTTNANGKATFSYVGNTAGTDTIQASFYCPVEQTTIYSNIVEKIWKEEAKPVGGHAAPIGKLSSPTPNIGLVLALVAAIFAIIAMTWWRGGRRSRATIGNPKIGP